MGGLYKKIPFTFAVMMIGTLAITGFPLLSGYFSKDMIIEAAFASQSAGSEFAFVMTVAAALMTSFYSWRLIFLTFFGESRADKHTFDHAHEGPFVMKFPLALLSIGALFAGAYFAASFIGVNKVAFWNGALVVAAGDVMDAAHDVPAAVVKAPFIAMLLGLFIALRFYAPKVTLPKSVALGGTVVFLLAWVFVPNDYAKYYSAILFVLSLYSTLYVFGRVTTDLPQRTAETWDGLYAFLLNKWYFDELYNLIFVRPAFWLGRQFWKRGDEQTIDGFGPNGVSSTIGVIAAKARKLQTGYVYHYAFAMIIGLAAVVTWFMVNSGGGH